MQPFFLLLVVKEEVQPCSRGWKWRGGGEAPSMDCTFQAGRCRQVSVDARSAASALHGIQTNWIANIHPTQGDVCNWASRCPSCGHDFDLKCITSLTDDKRKKSRHSRPTGGSQRLHREALTFFDASSPLSLSQKPSGSSKIVGTLHQSPRFEDPPDLP